MAGENKSKLNLLLRSWPAGTVATQPWLESKNIYQQLAYEYQRSGWVERIGRGAYVRPGDHVDWSGAVYALQTQLGLRIHVGGKSALEIKGLGHFAVGGHGDYLYLFAEAPQKLSSWFLKYDWKRRVTYKMPRLFNEPSLGLTDHAFATFAIKISTPERAAMELLHLVPSEQSGEEAALLFEGLVNLRPKIVQELLENCKSIKVKRLFLALAEQCEHSWLKRLSPHRIDLGKGKRAIVSGGTYNARYKVTLPKTKVGS